jgi:hypothetical protein
LLLSSQVNNWKKTDFSALHALRKGQPSQERSASHPNLRMDKKMTAKMNEINQWNKQSGFNFINILHTAFMRVDPESIKNTVKSFYTYRIFARESCAQNVDEIEPRCQFHQHFMCSFCKRRSQRHKKILMT